MLFTFSFQALPVLRGHSQAVTGAHLLALPPPARTPASSLAPRLVAGLLPPSLTSEFVSLSLQAQPVSLPFKVPQSLR